VIFTTHLQLVGFAEYLRALQALIRRTGYLGRVGPFRCSFVMVLHVRRECGRRTVTSVAHRTLERFLIVVRFHVYLQVIASDSNRQKQNDRCYLVVLQCTVYIYILFRQCAPFRSGR